MFSRGCVLFFYSTHSFFVFRGSVSAAGCGLAGFGGAGVARVSLMGYSFFYLQKLELSLWMVLATKEAEEGKRSGSCDPLSVFFSA